jgi:hypothetical protein
MTIESELSVHTPPTPAPMPEQPGHAEPHTATHPSGAEGMPPVEAPLVHRSSKGVGRWLVPIVVALLAATFGVVSASVVAASSADDLRSTNDAMRSELADTNEALGAANAQVEAARADILTCERVVTEAAALAGQFSRMQEIWDRYDTSDIVDGSPEDRALMTEFNGIVLEIHRLQGSVASAGEACLPSTNPA